MIRDQLRRLVSWLWRDHGDRPAALDGGPGPEHDDPPPLGFYRRPGPHCDFRWGAAGFHLCEEAPGHDGDHMCRCYAKAPNVPVALTTANLEETAR